MDKKSRREAIELSLLDGPNRETQVKDRPVKIVGRVLLLILLFGILITCYIFKFSSILYPRFFSYYLVSDFNTTSYYKVDSCDLVVIKPYNDISDAKEGDIICYQINSTRGSGVFLRFNQDILELEQENGEIIRVGKNSVIGEQVDTIAVIGFFFAFFESYAGIVFVTIVLLAYLAYITFSRVNYENTKHGKELLKELNKQKKEAKQRKKLLAELRDMEGLDYLIGNMLEGDYQQNRQRFYDFDYKIKGSVKEKYKYVLSTIHETYLSKPDLSRAEKRKITSVIELMCESEEFDGDMEYMLVDLALKTKLVDFDTKNFCDCASKFLKGKILEDDLLNFGSVLYILVKNNKKLRDENIESVAKEYLTVSESIKGDAYVIVQSIGTSIINLINS